jgi:adenosylcobinamide kinase/adenosylcobinamide-phosphate guanylyltransferase
MTTRRLIFLLGGARSGKSRYAADWGREHGQHVLFVATAQALDDEMRDKIAHHQAERPGHWTTLEAPYDLSAAIRQTLDGHDLVIVDCLTLLASNVLMSLPDNARQDEANARVLAEIDSLLNTYQASDATWLVVSNEVGMGIVPPTWLGRLYRNALGAANQRIAQAADEVLLFVAGLPWRLK